MSTGLIEVVVADGKTVVDGTGTTVSGGSIAQVLSSDIPSLVQDGFIATPSNPGSISDTAPWLAWSLYTTIQSALAAATALRPSQSGAAQLTQQLVSYGAEIENYASQLLTLINDGKVGGA